VAYLDTVLETVELHQSSGLVQLYAIFVGVVDMQVVTMTQHGGRPRRWAHGSNVGRRGRKKKSSGRSQGRGKLTSQQELAIWQPAWPTRERRLVSQRLLAFALLVPGRQDGRPGVGGLCVLPDHAVKQNAVRGRGMSTRPTRGQARQRTVDADNLTHDGSVCGVETGQQEM
jgi:hypothetical protein